MTSGYWVRNFAMAGVVPVHRAALEVVDLHQDALDDRQHFAARIGQVRKSLAMTHEDRDAELFLEFPDRLGQAGLGGVEGKGGGGQIEVAPDGLTQVT